MDDCLDSSPDTSKGHQLAETCNGEQYQIDGTVPCRNDGSNQYWPTYKNYPVDDTSLLQYGHYQIPPRKTFDHIKDKELRKKLKNRESAQAARDRKKAKMIFLEARVSELVERNRYLETKNENLLKYIMNMKARNGAIHQDGEEEMVIYNGHYNSNSGIIDVSRNLPMPDCNTLAYNNGRLDRDAYFVGNIHSEGGNRPAADLRSTPPYQHGYTQPQDCYNCVPYLTHKYPEATENTCDLRSDSSGDSAVADCRRSTLEPDDCKAYTSTQGVLDLGMRTTNWSSPNGASSTGNINIKESTYPFHSDGPDSVLFEPVKEKKIFATSDWENNERQSHDAPFPANAHSEGDSLMSTASPAGCAATGRDHHYNRQSNEMHIGNNPFPEDKFMLEVH